MEKLKMNLKLLTHQGIKPQLIKPLQTLRLLLIGLFTLTALNGCGTVNIKDFEACQDLGEYGAHCAHFLTPATRDIPKAQWDEMRFGQFSITYQTLADLKADIEKLCNVSKKCTYEQQQQIAKIQKTLDGFKSHATRLHILREEDFRTTLDTPIKSDGP
jgi:hypothetical protein